jgi:colicin import membrane protein
MLDRKWEYPTCVPEQANNANLMKLKKIGLSCLLLAAFQIPAFAEDEIERMNRIREEERRQFDQDQRNREQDERNRMELVERNMRENEQRAREQDERQREAERMQNEQRNTERFSEQHDRQREAQKMTAEQQDAADMEWLSYPDEDLDTMARLYIAKINANPHLSAEARIRLQNKYLLEIARMKKDKAMRESRLLEVERQKMDIERQRLEIELLRAKLAADAKQAPAGK